MHTKRIIPCLDVKAGRVVKGTNFMELRDAGDPVELAGIYDAERADELVFLDITASVEKRKSMLDVVNRTAGEVFMPLTVGGGITTVEDIRNTLKAGADKISVNSAAVKDPMYIAQLRNTVTVDRLQELIVGIREIPEQIHKMLENVEQIKIFATKYGSSEDAFFLGRSLDYAVALEGALKLKEISYIHASS